jgi:gentisate 1,2-dioxygenase
MTVDQERLLEALPSHNVEPLWTVMSAMVPPNPAPRAATHLWKYKEMRPLLFEAGRVVSEKEAERRVLMLINPELSAPNTTETLYAGLQLINPGETAPAHRHTAFALRFIIEGSGGFTAVEGRKLNMEEGDVILTPRWQWHDHGKEGDGPMVWLDGLDLPIFQYFPVNFAEMYSESRYPSTPVEKSPIVWKWASVQASLDKQDIHHAVYNYMSQESPKEHISTILSAQAEKLAAGKSSPPRQETSSFVYHVYRGTGHTIVKQSGKETILRWNDKDTFCIPSWAEFEHVNEGTEPAYLFNFSDTALLSNLGLHRSAE